MTPIIAFEYRLNDDVNIIHTDGDRCLPSKKSFYQTNEYEPLKIYVSYVSFHDPDHKNKTWYQRVASYTFYDEPTMKDALADLIIDYKKIYSYITKEIPYESIDSASSLLAKFGGSNYPTLDSLS